MSTLKISEEGTSSQVAFSTRKGGSSSVINFLAVAIGWSAPILIMWQAIFELTHDVRHPILFALAYFLLFGIGLLIALTFTFAAVTAEFGVQIVTIDKNELRGWLAIGKFIFGKINFQTHEVKNLRIEKVSHKRRHSGRYEDFSILIDHKGQSVTLINSLNNDQAIEVEKFLRIKGVGVN